MKRAKRLYTLLGILAVVSVLTFCVLNYQEKQEEIKASGEVVLSIDPEEVTAFSWEYEALEPLSFHKDEMCPPETGMSTWRPATRSALSTAPSGTSSPMMRPLPSAL